MNEREFYTVRGYQMLNENKLTSSMEDYMEMIYRISKENDYIRVNQLADKLNVRPSSTTKVVQKLNKLGMIHYQRYGIIQLTEEGKEIGKFLLGRHEILEGFLKNLGIKETLLKDTEMMEHDMSLNTLKSIDLLNQFLSINPDVLEKYYAFKKNFSEDTL
ncbi:MAG: metal-dependent transcriptional regulator [Eubacteriales bacterium]